MIEQGLCLITFLNLLFLQDRHKLFGKPLFVIMVIKDWSDI